ncbi:MAG: tRNA (adenosine(37)-N6)-threonylcarbamoyltransferase complex dimerization subunit type 1 TsaB [Proteobacteria bacterium]|nr:tRNA (adenosine(37)-N6)-threonylcarbamoyltransferase complex dimerization subunit type 1 TsaB [Pseudomonadota bacterium]
MQYLAIDTTSNFTKLALFNTETEISFSTCKETGMKQSSTLMPLINDLLIKAQIPMEEIDNIIVNLGPGPYTSLRIGIATSKGLALPFGTRVIGINSFDVYKYLYVKEDIKNAVVIIQNTSKQAYLNINKEHKIISVDELSATIPANSKVYGNGVEIYEEHLADFQTIKNTSEIKPMDLIKFVLDTKCDNTNLTPLYIKPLAYRKQVKKV